LIYHFRPGEIECVTVSSHSCRFGGGVSRGK